VRAKLPPWPRWAEKSLQGLAFWIGHRNALYAGHPLSEAALIAEACNLIYANLATGERLECERLYRTLVPEGAWPLGFGRRARADLVIVRRDLAAVMRTHKVCDEVTAVVEVKRASSSSELINQDLRRLATVKAHKPHIRAMLFLVSEAARPRRFVSPRGTAILGPHGIPRMNACYRVRRACKATAAFSGRESAHYACIVEVFGSHTAKP
jgi:hypothetical protein